MVHHDVPATMDPSLLDDINAKMNALEFKLQAMEAENRSLRMEANHAQTQDTEFVKRPEVEQIIHEQHSEKLMSSSNDNLVFFRGGYGYNLNNRLGTLENDKWLLNGNIGGHDEWYFGAGFDFSLDKDFFGLLPNTEVAAELVFDYKELGDSKLNGMTAAVTNAAVNGADGTLPAVNVERATVSAITLAASPKIKFFKGEKIRPWLIPAGFELTVISPPSNAITYINPGMMFAAGADYNVWRNIHAGADVRWHQAFDNVDGVNTNGLTAGGYMGIGF
jgi:opacity protein-like surface antigen